MLNPLQAWEQRASSPWATRLDPSRGPRREFRPRPPRMGPPTPSPMELAVTHPPQVTTQQESPFRQMLVQMLEEAQNRGGNSGMMQLKDGPLPGADGIDYDEVQRALRELPEPKFPEGPMSPEERRAFLFEWGLRGLGASGQPRASFAGAIGTSGTEALMSHRERRSAGYERDMNQQDRRRQRLLEGHAINVDRANRSERRDDRLDARERQRRNEILQLAGLIQREDQDSFMPITTEEGVFAFNNRSGTANPLEVGGQRLRGRGSEREFEIDRRYNYALEMYRSQGYGDAEAETLAREAALRLNGSMSQEEIYASQQRTAMALVSGTREFQTADAAERQRLLRQAIIGVRAMDENLLNRRGR